MTRRLDAILDAVDLDDTTGPAAPLSWPGEESLIDAVVDSWVATSEPIRAEITVPRAPIAIGRDRG